MKKKDGKITLIVPLQSGGENLVYKIQDQDDAQHPRNLVHISDESGLHIENVGYFKNQLTRFKNYVLGGSQEIDNETVRTNLEKCINQVSELLKNMKNKGIEGWELDGVSVSLAISAEGSIGIATAGIESGIELNFSRKPSAK
ncbi:MAG TPA: hypothetical protein VF721_04790 [Pyrinomonadaceae bacterium]|jgi:hypothetical protein